MNLSFAGCGFMGFYHLGVAACIRSYLPDLCFRSISGASAGAIAAVCLLCDAPLGEITALILDIATKARNRLTGPFSPCLDIQAMLKDGLEKHLPDDAHHRVNGRINISVTSVYTQKNEVLTHFRSKDELIQALMCSSFIPGFSGFLPPKFRGSRYIDGGFTKNLLMLEENTITVSPFCGLSHICPRDSGDTIEQIKHVVIADTSIELSLANLNRIFHIMFPPDTETLSQICQQGFYDAKFYLERNNLIGCHPCITSRWQGFQQNVPVYETCVNCELQRKTALDDGLPDTVFTILHDAIETANREFTSRIFNNPLFKLVTLFSMPYLLPVEVIVAFVIKILRSNQNNKSSFSSATTNLSAKLTMSTILKDDKLTETEENWKNEALSEEVTLGLEIGFCSDQGLINYDFYYSESLEEMIAHNEQYEKQIITSYS